MNTSGEAWKQQRNFVITALHDLGMGSEAMETKIGPEMIQLTSTLLDLDGKSFDPHDIMLVTASNVVFNVCFGKRFEKDDPEFSIFAKSLKEVFSSLGSDSVLHYLPFLGWLPGDPFKFNKLSESHTVLVEFTLRHLKSRFDRLAEEPVCLADLYLRKIQLDTESEEHSDFDIENLTQILIELSLAGSETTASTLQWLLLYLALNTKVQDTAHAEIDQVLEGAFPCYADRLSLPYTDAVILETQRLADVTPFAMMHAANKDTRLEGFEIPHNALIIPSITSVMMDPRLFPQPDIFRPERFLGVQRDRLRDLGLIPFFLGKRTCLGESMAKMELFLLSVAMLQHFRFVLPEGTTPPCLKGTLGATRHPQPFKIRALRRERN